MALKISRVFIWAACLSLISLAFATTEIEVGGTGDPVPPGMVLVKGGTFEMGSHEISSDEEPVHNVTINGFYIGKYEVTQKEWQAVMGHNPSLFKGDRLPVENVAWTDAVEYCNRKSRLAGLAPCYEGNGDSIICNFDANGYRLSTEAEWEYACRGGLGGLAPHDYLYSGSNDAGEVAWHEENSGEKTHPVGQKKANELGIYDMSGNVREWCWDRYDNEYYKTGPADNPPGALTGRERSHRGGSACTPLKSVRCSARFSFPPAYKYFDLGFRVVRNDHAAPLHDENMVFVKGGTYKMGGDLGMNGEKIVHRVTVDSFYIGKYEVTQEEWKRVMKNNPAVRKGQLTPVNYMDWVEAVAYCNKRSLMEGLVPCYSGDGDRIACNFKAGGYRLPTEAEWEYAARGGMESHHYKYSGGNEPGEVAWYRDNIYVYYQPVGQKKPNELGIYDMSGNIGEWCWDWYGFDYYRYSPSVNPEGPLTGVRRAVRGGYFVSPASALWSASRSYETPNRKALILGLRVVRTAQ